MGSCIFYIGIVCCLVAGSHAQGFNGVGNGGNEHNGQNNQPGPSRQNKEVVQANAGPTESPCDRYMRLLREVVDGELLDIMGAAEDCENTEEQITRDATASRSSTRRPTQSSTTTTQAPKPPSPVPQSQAVTQRSQPSSPSSSPTTTTLPVTQPQAASSSTRNLITPSSRKPSPSTQPPTPSSTSTERPRNSQPSGRVPNFAPPGHTPNTRPPVNDPTTTTTSPTTTSQPTTTQQSTTTARPPTTTQPPSTTTSTPSSNSRPLVSMILPEVKPTIPNNCGVRLIAQADCREFNGQRCGPKTRFDINECVCAHELSVDPSTCKTSPY
ncbi:salivary glue protein Sgs-3-like [Watersipora subatra]|uniref:salivary glue protein Sgs-3-like n=1 Tax=Watersipora subatra TaxID=2589382 RepID=UPI00355C49EC